MDNEKAVQDLLESKVASATAPASQLRAKGIVLMACSIVPLLLLVVCLIWVVPTDASPWAFVGISAACLSLCLVVWNIGSHFSKLSASQLSRARQLEDLQLYFLSVPKEKWPAKELLKVVITGRQTPYDRYVEESAFRAQVDDEDES